MIDKARDFTLVEVSIVSIRFLKINFGNDHMQISRFNG